MLTPSEQIIIQYVLDNLNTIRKAIAVTEQTHEAIDAIQDYISDYRKPTFNAVMLPDIEFTD